MNSISVLSNVCFLILIMIMTYTYTHLFLCSAGTGTTSRSFQRLKVQRVKDLVKESYRRKKQSNELEDDQQKAESSPSRMPVLSLDESDVLDEKKVIDVQKHNSKALRSGIKSSGRSFSSEFSAPSSKKWGNVDPVDSYRSKVDNVSKRGQKLKANSDFFSRKSFKELGCNDYIIDSLRSLQYIRPSHIQVI